MTRLTKAKIWPSDDTSLPCPLVMQVGQGLLEHLQNSMGVSQTSKSSSQRAKEAKAAETVICATRMNKTLQHSRSIHFQEIRSQKAKYVLPPSCKDAWLNSIEAELKRPYQWVNHTSIFLFHDKLQAMSHAKILVVAVCSILEMIVTCAWAKNSIRWEVLSSRLIFQSPKAPNSKARASCRRTQAWPGLQHLIKRAICGEGSSILNWHSLIQKFPLDLLFLLNSTWRKILKSLSYLSIKF